MIEEREIILINVINWNCQHVTFMAKFAHFGK